MSSECSSKILLVDASSIAVGLFYAMNGQRFLKAEAVPFQELTDFITEVATTAISNVVRRQKIDEYDAVRVALESPPWREVERYNAYADYKHAVTKSDKPRIAKTLQGPIIQAAIDEGIPTLFSPGWEADDVIASMVGKLDEDWLEENEVHIWSQDKDLHQLLTHPNIKMIGKGGEITTMDDAIEYWGHAPEAVPLLKALMGDTSDNIPGIRGVGLKSAQTMIRPAPFAKGVPFTVDPSLIPAGDKRQEVTQLLPRIAKFTKLCTLRRDLTLWVGEGYFDEDSKDK